MPLAIWSLFQNIHKLHFKTIWIYPALSFSLPLHASSHFFFASSLSSLALLIKFIIMQNPSAFAAARNYYYMHFRGAQLFPTPKTIRKAAAAAATARQSAMPVLGLRGTTLENSFVGCTTTPRVSWTVLMAYIVVLSGGCDFKERIVHLKRGLCVRLLNMEMEIVWY